VRRHKTTIQIVVVAAMLLLAGGTTAEARGAATGRDKAQITRIAKPKPSFWQWLKIRLSRYAMAAN
jgi:hypothetical protein